MDVPVKFEQLVQFRVPTNMSAAIDQAAKQKCQSKSDYVRQSVVRQLEADGIALPHATPDAGSLYDRLADGRQRYALIVGDDIAGITYCESKPEDGRNWIPVAHADSEPFDAARHWRLAPVYTIEAGRVVCTYPVVAKSLEFA
ncbi:hypothetical protein [Bradyrhizobium japonicum]|uniref:hypothetical protein n=1 Tax=Bradyrhizobium japonicum TaxID=375 RepID=UPI00271543D6|nr:hypothetical protein [Bradyrhizobium japonicum]WLB19365.1 hypothetical protein QIH95_46950 [Bradyrhizobium japonicum]